MSTDLTLHGDVVTLREFRADDVDDILALIGDDRMTAWLSFDARGRAEAEAMLVGVDERRRQEPRVEYYLAITPRDGDGRCAGFVRLAFDGVEAGKLGYAVAFDRWGMGYATDATRVLVDHGFRALGLHRISATIGPDNAASIRMAERLGMVCEGRIHDHVHTNGAWRDSLLYSVLADEWSAAAPAQGASERLGMGRRGS